MPYRVAGRFLRSHIIQVLVVVLAAAVITEGIGLALTFRLNSQIIEARQRECSTGNTVRGHIAFVDQTLHDILVVALTLPPVVDNPQQRAARERFQEAVDRLSGRLPALMPRDCSRAAASGERAAPAR